MQEIGRRFDLLWKALKKFDDDHGFFLSSGITFNLLICLIPLSLLLLGLTGTYLYSDREVLNHIRLYLESVAPSLDPRVMRNILKIVQGRKIVGILGIGGLIWTSTWVFSSLRTALNLILQVEKGRGIVRGKAVDLLMIFLVGILHLASMTLTSAISYIQRYRFKFPLDLGPLIEFSLKYFIPFLFTFWMFFLIYKIIPDRKIQFKNALQAALFTSLLWEAAKQFFGWYVLNVGKFSAVYGSLSTLIIFVLWVYYSSAILILGGEFAFLLEERRGGRLRRG
ncbi:MAG: YihY/virulence factor BrkB family protein [Thermodesulfobacteriota bacterium]|nr:YihY/virulence factor BrkB family protein [Thermodesulfobacteriota bacterium]